MFTWHKSYAGLPFIARRACPRGGYQTMLCSASCPRSAKSSHGAAAGVTHREAACRCLNPVRLVPPHEDYSREALTLIHMQRREYKDRTGSSMRGCVFLLESLGLPLLADVPPPPTPTDSFLPATPMLLPDNHAATPLPQPPRPRTQNRRLCPSLTSSFSSHHSHINFPTTALRSILTPTTPHRTNKMKSPLPGLASMAVAVSGEFALLAV